ncbi:MAG: hypothetical protein AAF922_08375 [Pseudomonadota bacterium]
MIEKLSIAQYTKAGEILAVDHIPRGPDHSCVSVALHAGLSAFGAEQIGEPETRGTRVRA